MRQIVQGLSSKGHFPPTVGADVAFFGDQSVVTFVHVQEITAKYAHQVKIVPFEEQTRIEMALIFRKY